MHPIQHLEELGQSVWLDYLDHDLVVSGELERMIWEDGVRGVTSNPTIFQKSIAGSSAYDSLVRGAAPGISDRAIFESIEVATVALACDKLRPLYDRLGGRDGFVSIEVSPDAARDTAGSIEEARRLWASVRRPNVMVKIPGTREGVPAIERCLAEGININITLLFSVDRYVDVAEAYLAALETRVTQGKPLDRIASVASFFVSRVDTKVDQAIKHVEEHGGPKARVANAERGHAAIANAKLAYDAFRHVFSGERWGQLVAMGARPQRVLWASTSTKDPSYPELYYAEALVGPGTIDTMTPETLRAYRAHGQPEVRLDRELAQAQAHIDHLASAGLSFPRMTTELEQEGIRAFEVSFEKAVATIAARRHSEEHTSQAAGH